MLLRFFVGYLFCVGLVASLSAAQAPMLASELTTRYAPYANWQSVVDVDALAQRSESRYWRTAEEIALQRGDSDLPLAGLHIALDPGHIGGQWAAAEGRQFRIAENDFYVREGELVLVVAQLARAKLMALGAKVTLLREAAVRVNPNSPLDHLELAAEQVSPPNASSLSALWVYGRAIRARAVHLSIVKGDLMERARSVNKEVQPDALISLHINAAAWPTENENESEASESGSAMLRLVDANNLHVLIFGCLSDEELQAENQLEQLAVKLTNGSGPAERLLGGALATALAEATELPAARYRRNNAILLSSQQPYLFARNLLLLRMAECPTVLLEPYVANSVGAYGRLQSALANRAADRALAEDDILLQYADAVVAGVRACYGQE
jgi:N-acetylmuramoyl-L-alanine amidase